MNRFFFLFICRNNCPFKEKMQQTTFAEHEHLLNIYNFRQHLKTQIRTNEGDEWGVNDS